MTISAAAGTCRSMVVHGADLQRLAEQAAHHLELADVGGRVGERAHGDERVEAEDDGAGQRLAPRLRPALVLEHPAARVQAHAQAIGGP